MDWDIAIAIFAILGGLSALFDHILKEAAVKKTKVEILKWWEVLNQFDFLAAVKNTNRLFVKIFNDIYGKRHFTIKCFSRSCLFSSLGLIFAMLVCNFLRPLFIGMIVLPFIRNAFFIFLGNLIADYLSLIETRYVLKFAYTHSLLLLLPLLIVDIILSFICYLLVVGVGLYLPSNVLFYNIPLWNAWERIWLYIPLALFHFDTLTPFIYSTFFTSVLFYLFVLATMAVKFLHFLKVPVSTSLRWIGSLDNPFKTIASILAAIILLMEGIKRFL